MGDFLYNAPTDQALRLHARSGQPGYLYILHYQGTKTFGTLQRDAPREIVRDSYGVTHMDDSFYILPSEYNPSQMDNTAESVASSLTRCIFQFVNPNGLANNCQLRTYTAYERNVLNFVNERTPQNSLGFRRPEDMSFWNELITRVIEFTATPPPYFPYHEYNSFQAATWSMLAFVLVLVLIVVGLAAVLCINKRKEKRSLKLLRARDRELEERYNNNA